MTNIAIILSSLALLAATAGLALAIRERKRSKERNTALVRYAERLMSGALTEAEAKLDAAMCAIKENHGCDISKLEGRIHDLEGGIVPDFEKAKEAAHAVNDFNAGISGILGFDPMAVLKKQRESAGDS